MNVRILLMLVCLKGKAMNNIFPKVSIIIPVYKVEEYIEDCILSVMSQTYLGGLECIIVDDCTPDNSIALIQKLIKDYKGNIQFKIVHHKENKGLSSARNTGLKYAKGEYMYFLDSDDELYPTCIQDLALPLSKKKYDFVIGDYSVKGDIIFEIPKLLLETGEVLDTENIVSSYEYSKWYMMAWNKLCNLKFIKDNNLYFKESIIHEDDLWSFQTACLAKEIYIVRKETYIYRLRSNSIMSSNNKEKHIRACISVVNFMSDFVSENNIIDNHSLSIINNYKLKILNDSVNDKILYNKLYIQLRSIKGDILFCLLKSTKGKLINFIGNFHKVLPLFLGKFMLYYYVRLLRVRPLHRFNNLFAGK